MKTVLRFILGAVLALPLAGQNTTLQKVPATPATANSNKLTDASKVFIVGDGGSITATGTGVIVATGGVATSIPWSGVTGTPTTLAGYGITNGVPNTRTISTTAPLTGGGALSGDLTFAMPAATSSVNGYLTSANWTTFNAKESALTFSAPLARSTNTISIPVATSSVNGYLSSADWTTFNAKQAALTLGNFTEATSSVLTITGGTGSIIGSGLSVQVKLATTSQSGYLSSTDWTTFNAKQAAGNYLTALTGDVTASGPGSAAATLATVNSNVGTFGSSSAVPVVTVDGKGRITAISTAAISALPDQTGHSGAFLTTNGTAASWSAGLLSIASGKTLTASNTLTLAGTDGSTLNVGAGGTLGSAAFTAASAYAPATSGSSLLYGNGSGGFSNATVTTASGISFSAGALALGSIPNSSLSNSTVTVGTTSIALGASSTTIAGLTSVAGLSTITGGAGNMTIVAGTGNSRTLIFQTTTSGGTATTFLTGNADQSATFAGTTDATTGGAGALTTAGGFYAEKKIVSKNATLDGVTRAMSGINTITGSTSADLTIGPLTAANQIVSTASRFVLDNGQNTVAIGTLAGGSTDQHNVWVGYRAGGAAVGLRDGVGVGYGALQAMTYGNDNTAVGLGAMQLCTVSGYNSAFGNFALNGLTTGTPVVTAGSFAAAEYVILSVGTTNFTAIGAASNTVGVVFTATGAGSGTGTAALTQVGQNVGVGNTVASLYNGNQSTFVGAFSWRYLVGGNRVTAVGSAQGSGGTSDLRSVSNSDFYGYGSGGHAADGQTLVSLYGYGSDVTTGTETNAAAFGPLAKVTNSNQISLGAAGDMSLLLGGTTVMSTSSGTVTSSATISAATRLSALTTNGWVTTTSTNGTLSVVAAPVTNISGTNNQITASASTGSVTLSLPSGLSGISSITQTAISAAGPFYFQAYADAGNGYFRFFGSTTYGGTEVYVDASGSGFAPAGSAGLFIQRSATNKSAWLQFTGPTNQKWRFGMDSDSTSNLQIYDNVNGVFPLTVTPGAISAAKIAVNLTTAASSTTTGSFVNAGGFGNAGAAYIGGLLNVAGVLTAANTTDASNTTTAGTVVSGGLAVAKKSYIGHDVHGSGNLYADTAGKTLIVKSGSNAAAGTVTLVAGTATITSTAIDANTVIAFSEKTAGGTPGVYQPLAAVASGSAVVTSAVTDTSTYNWVAVKVN